MVVAAEVADAVKAKVKDGSLATETGKAKITRMALSRVASLLNNKNRNDYRALMTSQTTVRRQ